MAFQMIHMEIAFRVIEKLGICEDREEFILGSVSPDSVHMREDYNVRDKIHSHLFEGCGPWGDTQDYDRWLANIFSFINQCKNTDIFKNNRMLIAGIFTHCVTDYFNDIVIWRGAQKESNLPTEMFKSEFYIEARAIDEWLYQNSENTQNIMMLLKNSREEGLEDYYTAKDISKLKNNLLNIQYNIPKVSIDGFKYFSKDKLLKFLEDVADYVYQNLLEQL